MTTGYRINRAKDDAAGFFVSQRFASHLSSMARIQDNTKHGIALLETAEGSLNNITTLLQRLRDLAEQAANGVYGTDSRDAMQAEANQIIEQINQIVETTEYNDLKILKMVDATTTGITTTSLSTARTLSAFKNASVNINGVKQNINNEYTSNSSIDEVVSESINSVFTQGLLPISEQNSIMSVSLADEPATIADTEIADAYDFAVGETKTIVIDSVSYTVTNNRSVSNTLSYIKNMTSGELTFLGNNFKIVGQDGVSHNLIITGGSNVVYGGDQNDKIVVSKECRNEINTIYGQSGDDEIIAYTPQGSLNGGSGNDTITFAQGYYSYFNGSVSGGADNDTININVAASGAAVNTINGNAGNDIFNINSGTNHKIYGGDGDDTFNYSAGTSMLINGGAGTNTIVGGSPDSTSTTVNVVGANSSVVTVAANSTQTVMMNGINYTITNPTASTLSVYYSVDASGRLNIKHSSSSSNHIIIRGDENVAHNVGIKSACTLFYGGNLNDNIVVGAVNANAYGNAGDDTIRVSSGVAFGGDGNDNITIGYAGAAFGGAGNDTVTGNQCGFIYGGDGDDTITGATSNNGICGGEGTNSVTATGSNNFISGTPSSDSEFVKLGANETKTVTIGGQTYTVQNRLGQENALSYYYNPVSGEVSLGGGYLTITASNGTSHNVKLYGKTLYFYGGDGDDTINDYSYGSTIYGNAGNDIIKSCSTADGTYYGDDGDDNLSTSAGSAGIMSGGNGNDTITINNSVGFVYGGAGNDTFNLNYACSPIDTGGNNIYNINANGCTVSGSSDADTFYINSINNIVTGAGGDDYFVVDKVGTNDIDGGTGINLYVDNSSGTAHFTNVTLDPNSGVLNFTYIGEVKTFTIDGKTYTVTNQTSLGTSQATNSLQYSYNPNTGQITVSGSNFTIDSDAASCNLGVRGNNNIINGSALDDKIIIENGSNNQVNGLAGNDNLIMDTANNSMNGGDGSDSIILNASTNKEVTGGTGDDVVTINSSNNTNINTGEGNDIVNGNGSSNIVNLGDGDNNALLTGNSNQISASDGNNHLSVVGNNNKITAGNGNNTLGVEGDSNNVTTGNGGSTLNIYGNSNTASAAGGLNTTRLNGDRNTYNGGSDVDNITITGDYNIANGGDSNDTFVVARGNENTVDGNAGDRNLLRDRGTNTHWSNIYFSSLEPFKLNVKVDTGTDDNNYIKAETGVDFMGFTVDFSTSELAVLSLGEIDYYLEQVQEQIMDVGISINTLESAFEAQTVKTMNLTSSISTIKDADIAAVSSSYVRYMILQQATATLMASTRNLRRESILGIIGSIQLRT